jgi:excisionase family DNA binding protein
MRYHVYSLSDGGSAMRQLMTKQQVAEALKVSVPTVDRYMRRGLPFIKFDDGNGTVRFDPDAVTSWVLGQQQQQPQPATTEA